MKTLLNWLRHRTTGPVLTATINEGTRGRWRIEIFDEPGDLLAVSGVRGHANRDEAVAALKTIIDAQAVHIVNAAE